MSGVLVPPGACFFRAGGLALLVPLRRVRSCSTRNERLSVYRVCIPENSRVRTLMAVWAFVRCCLPLCCIFFAVQVHPIPGIGWEAYHMAVSRNWGSLWATLQQEPEGPSFSAQMKFNLSENKEACSHGLLVLDPAFRCLHLQTCLNLGMLGGLHSSSAQRIKRIPA